MESRGNSKGVPAEASMRVRRACVTGGRPGKDVVGLGDGDVRVKEKRRWWRTGNLTLASRRKD